MTDWTAEEERVAKAISQAYWRQSIPNLDSLELDPTEFTAWKDEARAAIAAMSSWRDVKTDPPPRDGTNILAWIDGFGMGPQVLFWLDGGWREPANHMRLKKEFPFWQPITPPLPPAPENHDA